MRKDHLLSATDKFLSTHNAWVDSDDQLLTNAFEAAILEMFHEFAAGDIPENCRGLTAAVSLLQEEWEKYEGYVTQLRPMPRDTFWAAVAEVIKERKGAEPRVHRPLEPIKLLFEQKVDPRQIAVIYAHNGIGPFMRDGEPQIHLVYQEYEKPGSVIPEGWVHPGEAAARREADRLEKMRLRRLEERFSQPPTGPESIEELLRQRVSPNQICAIKNCTLDEVFREARRIGVDPEPSDLEEIYRRHNPLLPENSEATPPANVGQIDLDTEFDGDLADEQADEPENDPDEQIAGDGPGDPIDQQIMRLAGDGKSSMEIARELGVTVQKAAAVIRAAKRHEAALEATQAEPAGV